MFAVFSKKHTRNIWKYVLVCVYALYPINVKTAELIGPKYSKLFLEKSWIFYKCFYSKKKIAKIWKFKMADFQSKNLKAKLFRGKGP